MQETHTPSSLAEPMRRDTGKSNVATIGTEKSNDCNTECSSMSIGNAEARRSPGIRAPVDTKRLHPCIPRCTIPRVLTARLLLSAVKQHLEGSGLTVLDDSRRTNYARLRQG